MLFSVLRERKDLPPEIRASVERYSQSPTRYNFSLLVQDLAGFSGPLAAATSGKEVSPANLHDTSHRPVSDWSVPDYSVPDVSVPDRRRARKRFPIVVYADHVRSPYNLGSIIRTAEGLGAAGVMVSPDAPRLDHPRLVRAAMGCDRWIPVRRGNLSEALRWIGGTPVVLETGGTPLFSASFPPSGVLVLGNEELGVSPETLELAASVGRQTVQIPMWGRKASLNVGVALGIALSRWVQEASEGASGAVSGQD